MTRQPEFNEHRLPDKVYNASLLDKELRDALGADCDGVKKVKTEWYVLLHRTISDSKAAQAIGIAVAHNPTELTPQQQQRKTQHATLKTLHGKRADTLTAAEVRILITYWLYQRGWLAEDGTINTEGV